MTIKQVPVAKILAELDLIAEYAAECSIPAIGEINPNLTIYAALESSGMLHSFAVYDDAKMVGFANILTPILPHYSKRVATVESLFMAKANRNTGMGGELMRHIENFAKGFGCVGLLYSAPSESPLEYLLQARDYQRTNAVFFRSLG